MITNLQAMKIKFMGATNTKGARTKIIDERFEESITLSYGYEFNNSIDQAIQYLQSKGFNIVGKTEDRILVNDFRPLKEIV